MKEKYIHISSFAIVICGLVLVAFLYWTEPRSLAEVSTKGKSRSGRTASIRPNSNTA
ncbi:MAG: hypothetical protein IPP63_18685 [Chloracidobacterium sp.]|nr:hypothetical protein [Chloracidobacterium sp.]